jgi:trans-2,3-dihydro-3-hydroxyanthranilate isomerase
VEAAARNGADIRARMFAPGMGIVEDPATGAAAAALAGYLAATRPPGTGTLRWVVDQGVEMGRPSRLRAAIEGDRVRVGGDVVTVIEGTVHLDG